KLSGHIFQLLKSSEFGIFGGESLSYARNSPFVPWHSIMTRIMGIDSFADPKQQFNQLCKVIKDSDPDNYFRLPIISEFLGFDCEDNNITKHFDGQLRRENLFDFIIQLLRFTAKENPICLVFEDSQWIDSSSISLIAYCMRNLLDLPIFLIIIRRLFDADAELKFVREIEDSGLSTTIELKELTRDETEKIILQQLKADQLSTELLDFVYRSSHGNPTFTEQFAENLLLKDRIKLVLSPENKQVFIELQGELNESDVPDSLNSLIMSQIDNLDPRSKLTVKIAAAVGSQLKTEIVTGAYPVKMSRDDIVNSLEQLELKDVLHKVDTNEFNYIFKNLVTRDVAYGSLLFSHRREYHKRIAYNIENLNEGNLVKFYEELAWHFSQSTEDKQALNYLSKAGDKAYDLYANESALSYYTQAIDRTSTEQNPKERYNLLNMRSKVYSALGRREPQKQDLDELLELTDIRKDMKSKVGVLSNIALYYNMVNKLDEMKTVIDQAQEILETFDFPFGRIAINNYSGRLHFVKHEFNEALQYFKLCMVDAEKYNDQKGLSVAFTNCGMTYKAMGDFERALDYYKKSISIDLEIGNKKSEALNLGNTGVIYHQQGDIESAAVAYRNALRIAREIGSKQVQAYFLGNLAYIFQLKGERKQALGSHEELLKLTQKMGYFKGQVLSLNNIGAWYQEFGDCKKAIHYYGQAFEIATCSNLKGLIPMILLNKGLALHYQGELSKANEILNQGLRKSIEINSKPTEDYARRYLGFVLIDQQKLDDAKYQFVAAESIAQSIGSKASLASVKVGLGTIDMMNDLRDRYLIQEGISEAEKLGDQEVLLKGLINQAKLMIRGKEKTDDILTILNKAYGVADKSGLTCDLNIIKGLIESVTP
ncbi:tetratricopeptide repeat protein, partial [bacterium]|nr:tetratricopeptide repeat protein [bacterium]